jgi:hypothetical protein
MSTTFNLEITMFNKADEVSQRERREVLRNDRRVREAATFHSVEPAWMMNVAAGLQ